VYRSPISQSQIQILSQTWQGLPDDGWSDEFSLPGTCVCSPTLCFDKDSTEEKYIQLQYPTSAEGLKSDRRLDISSTIYHEKTRGKLVITDRGSDNPLIGTELVPPYPGEHEAFPR